MARSKAAIVSSQLVGRAVERLPRVARLGRIAPRPAHHLRPRRMMNLSSSCISRSGPPSAPTTTGGGGPASPPASPQVIRASEVRPQARDVELSAGAPGRRDVEAVRAVRARPLKGPIRGGESSDREGSGARSVPGRASSPAASCTSRRGASSSALRRSCRSCRSARASAVTRPIIAAHMSRTRRGRPGEGRPAGRGDGGGADRDRRRTPGGRAAGAERGRRVVDGELDERRRVRPAVAPAAGQGAQQFGDDAQETRPTLLGLLRRCGDSAGEPDGGWGATSASRRPVQTAPVQRAPRSETSAGCHATLLDSESRRVT